MEKFDIPRGLGKNFCSNCEKEIKTGELVIDIDNLEKNYSYYTFCSEGCKYETFNHQDGGEPNDYTETRRIQKGDQNG